MNILSFFSKYSAERSNDELNIKTPFFYQHQKVYKFCQPQITNKEVLEIGSGNGFGAYYLSKFSKKYTAIDKDVESIKKSRLKYKRQKLNFIPIDFNNYKSDNKFDVVILLQVVEHISDYTSFLKKAIKLLKKKGILIISTPNKITQAYNENPFHCQEFSKCDLKEILRKFDLDVEFFGLFGNKEVINYEYIKREQVVNLFKIDFLFLRRLLPRTIRQFLFSLASFLRFRLSVSKQKKININSYFIDTNNIDTAIDIICICKKLIHNL